MQYQTFSFRLLTIFLIGLLEACGGGSSNSNGTSQTAFTSAGNQFSSDSLPSLIETAEILNQVSIGNLTKTQVSLAQGMRNAPEHFNFISYLGSGKSIDGNPAEQIPFRTYTAACATDTEEPRMFVSMTLADESANANLDSPRVGSVFETRFNQISGALEPTGNQSVIQMCNEAHGIAVSDDCSTVAMMCATELYAPISETFGSEFTDLVNDAENDFSYLGGHINNEEKVDDPDRYQYNGEMWLLEWNLNGDGELDLTDEPDRYVIHKGYGGHPMGTADLVYNESDNTYGTAFTTSVFDNNGGRHRSAAMLVIDRDDWSLNSQDRGWGWACANGHVFFIRPFWNPYVPNRRTGEDGAYGTICTSDGNDWSLSNAGTIAIKYEDSDSFEGYSNYFLASNNSGVSKGGAHIVIPLNEERTIGILAAPDMHPWGETNFETAIATAEADALDFLGEQEVEERNLTGLKACNWYQDGLCLPNWARWEYSYDFDQRYPLFNWGFWYKNEIEQNDLSKIGIFHSRSSVSSGQNIEQDDGDAVKWVAEDDDCMLGAPQLVDLQNGRFLVGYGKFQCISDGFRLRRFATNTVNTRSVATLIPSEYYLMEIDADGNVLSEPTLVSGSGWGGVDKLISFGEGRAAWAYIPVPELTANGLFPDPSQNQWELLVYESNED